MQAFRRATVMRAVPALMDKAMAETVLDSDNCTAIAMGWAGAESAEMTPPRDAALSTLVIPDGAVTLTVQMPQPGELPAEEALTESQIEDAIAEIPARDPALEQGAAGQVNGGAVLRRAANEVRPLRIERGYERHAEGSALIEFGDTRVLAPPPSTSGCRRFSPAGARAG
jgi:RNAse PH (EC 2.7.7.56)